ncbi:M23 family metallopeptidase, partial [Arthrobacter sp. NPDC057009]|uniref:M23 family metallopeptidase n=1 Tax=Arthrobacter sp. NPDC057009 TaxID=3345996 RepID=UPI003626C455
MTVASRGLARPSSGTLLSPLEVLNPSSQFGLRIDPFTGAPGEFHWGQDFASGCGTRVYSADAGVARAVGWHPWGGGNRVEVDHGNGIITTYNHLESSALRQGESVKVGEVIARVGTTGSSTGCHLHFETIVKGIHVNPLNWKLLQVVQLDRLDELPRLTFEPGSGTRADRAPIWAVPVEGDKGTVTGGQHEAPVENTPSKAPSPPPSSSVPVSPPPSSSVPVSPPPSSSVPVSPPPSSSVPVSP